MPETIFDRSCDDDDDDTVVVHKVYSCLMRMAVCCSWQADARTQSQTLAITYTSSISWDVEKLMSIFLSEIKIKCKRTRLGSCYWYDAWMPACNGNLSVCSRAATKTTAAAAAAPMVVVASVALYTGGTIEKLLRL